jgi:hypothetical protein
VFGFFKTKKADVLSHWYTLAEDFNISCQEFYASIERKLVHRQVPGLEISRVNFSEGGILSANREYLRMTRERLVFDICAAPFGTSYFFSLRFAEIPAVIRPWEILIFFFYLFFPLIVLWYGCGFFLGSLIFIVTIGFGIWFLRNTISLGLKDLDASLIKTPVIGPIYEVFFRKETYYRQDTRLMYLETVNAVVKQTVAEFTSAGGINLLSIRQHAPLMDDLYRTTQVAIQPVEPPAQTTAEPVSS